MWNKQILVLQQPGEKLRNWILESISKPGRQRKSFHLWKLIAVTKVLMEKDGTEFISFPAEQHCADLAAASIKEDNGKHINQPWVIRAALQALAACDCVGYAAWCHPWFHSYVSPVKNSKNHLKNHPVWFTYKENKHAKGAAKGKCGFFISSSFDRILERYVLPNRMGELVACRQNPAFHLSYSGFRHKTTALPARHEKRRC